MKYFIITLVLSTAFLQAQINYNKGYFVDNNDNRVECFIKNSDWKTNSTQFFYKLTESSSEEEGNINSIQEFRIYDTEHYYIRYKLKKDLKDYDFNLLNTKNSFVFLRVLLEGKASLYELYNEMPFFFFQKNKKVIESLEYRKYVDENNRFKENNNFRKTLYENLKCDAFSVKTFAKIKYISNDLVELFSEYNKCNNSNFENLHKNRTKAKFNFKINLGLNHFSEGNLGFAAIYRQPSIIPGNPDIAREESRQELGLQSQTGILYGFETELLLPFNRNKWGVFLAPNYQKYSQNEKMISITDRFRQTQITYPVTYAVNYEFIELPIGLRYYMSLNQKSKIYLQVALAIQMHSNSEKNQLFIIGDTQNSSVEISETTESINQSNSSYFLGFGYNIFDKYSISFNYYFAKNVEGNAPVFSSQEGSFNLIASYIIF